MAKADKLVSIELDKVRHLKFNLNALILAEKTTGKKMAELGNTEGGFDMEFLRAMMYAGLKHEDKKLTLEDVGDMIDFNNLEEVTNKLNEAMQGLK